MPCLNERCTRIGRRRAFADRCAEITTVAHEQEGSHRGKSMQQSEHAALTLAHAVGQGIEQWPFQSDPVGSGVHLVLGKLELAIPNILVGKEFYLLEAHDLRTDKNIAVGMRTGGRGRCNVRFGCLEDADLRVANCIGVVVDVHLLYISLAFFEIEMLDVVLLAAVNINRFLVQENQRAWEIDFADYIGPACDIDDYEIVAADG